MTGWGRIDKPFAATATAAVAAATVAVAAAPRNFARPTAPQLPWRDTLTAWLLREVEQRRLFPWIAVAFGLGILLFFAAEGRPSLWAPVTGALLSIGAAILLRGKPVAFGAAIGLAALFAGFAAGVVRVRAVDAPVLGRVTIAALSGFAEAVEERPDGGRVLIRVHAVSDLDPAKMPRRVRVTVRDLTGIGPGSFVAGKVRLLPPPEPARPGGYDFARDAYFKGIGAVGSVLGKLEVRPPPVAPGWELDLAAGVDAARNTLTRRIADAVGGQDGAVLAALVTGKRGLIEEGTNDILRAAGIYHIISISGLHMVLAAGAFFWTARALLALVPAIALCWPVKKIAALVAMAGATAYCIFSGSEVATERSLVTTLVMLGAILVDRPALSIRNLAVAALIVLAREPETLLGPSFQMSFGAVAALIAVAGLLTGPDGEPRSTFAVDRLWRWVRRAVLAMLATTLVAGVATAPFSAYHFQAANPLGLIGNALALPLVSIVVMPAAVLGVVALPFGLDRPVWSVAGAAVAQVLGVAEWVSGLQGASLVVPSFEPGALALFVAALLLATLLVSPLRLVAVVPLLAGLAAATAGPRADLYVDRSGHGAAVRGSNGQLVVVGRASSFVVEQWLRADGDGRDPERKELSAGSRCDGLGCVATAPTGQAVAVVRDRRAFAEDCKRAAVIVSSLAAPAGCRAAWIFDRDFLATHGAVAVQFTPEGPKVRTVRRAGETRPWLTRAPDKAAAPRTGDARDGAGSARPETEDRSEAGDDQ